VGQRDSLRFLAGARRCALSPALEVKQQFFFFFFSRVFTVNRARLGRPPQWPPIAKIEHLQRIADTRLLFGG
jgi:hypothetical protein